ncbi:ankyrin repeat domain-containing protein [Candidatus Jidaibacter acanthamoebae]|uniref:ankyrin repeat domain-containing protein n=1 Tax=Candidatus Jidaibacter acanthamoebae TaxID=86105 RepID=UPI00057DA33F|nr:ankyrin repeat domain-containing protein [Candidatus Jidaibacter acanthamoeba]
MRNEIETTVSKKYSSKNFYTNVQPLPTDVSVPLLATSSSEKIYLPNNEPINKVLIKLCDQFYTFLEKNEQTIVISYYQQLIRQLNTFEPLLIDEVVISKIFKCIDLFINYSENLDSSNFVRIITLQTSMVDIIKRHYNHTELCKIKSSLYKNVGFLKTKTFVEQKETAVSLYVLPKDFGVIEFYAQALKEIVRQEEIKGIASALDKEIDKYIYQLSHKCLYEFLSEKTLKLIPKESPALFKNILIQYRIILERLAVNEKELNLSSLMRNFLYKAGDIIDTYRNKLKEPTGASYKYSLTDLDDLTTYVTQLLVDSDKIIACESSNKWRENWNKFREIRREVIKIEDIIERQLYLSQKIEILISQMVKEGEMILGKPPCDYIMLSLGSLSRKEFFPGSDLECLIILDAENKSAGMIPEYFKALAGLLKIQILAVGESKAGFALDGNDPATNFDEFVITINKLPEAYNEHCKNQHILGFSLLRPSLLYSSREDDIFFERYKDVMSGILASTHKQQAINQLEYHTSKFLLESRDNLSFMKLGAEVARNENKCFDIKECFYSPLVYLAIDLGLYYNIKTNNTLEIYEELHNRDVISTEFFTFLKEAYCYIVELRFEAHNFKKSHYDEIYLPNSTKSGCLVLEEEAFEKLKKINLEVITPLYKAVELIVKNKSYNHSGNKTIEDQATITNIDHVADLYCRTHCKNNEALDNPSIFAELISIYHRYYTREYKLEILRQREEVYLQEGLNSLSMPLPSKIPENAVIVEEAGNKYMLKPEVAENIITKDGSIVKQEGGYGRRNVVGITHNGYSLHIKENPELPGMEYTLGSLIRKIAGQGAPVTKLLKFTVDNRVYPVQISRTVKGINYQDALNGKSSCLSKISSKSFGMMYMASLLINPEDGKPDNYILEPVKGGEGEKYNIVCVDNDHGLVPALVKEKSHTKLMVKTILYCMPQMYEDLDKEVREQILALNHDELLNEWLTELIKKDNEYRYLFTVKEQEILLNQGERRGIFTRKYEKEGALPVVIPIMLKQGAVATLYQKFIQLKSILEYSEKITPMQLLYNIEPLLAKYYDDPKLKGLGAKEVFSVLCKDQYSTVMAGRFGTMVNSRQLLQSVLQEIPNLEDIVKKKHTPAQAIDEIKIIKLQSSTLNRVREQLLAGNDKPFKELLLDSFRERVINGTKGGNKRVNFAGLSESKQLFILQAMRGSSFTELLLSNCTVLTDAIINDILKDSPGLMVLNLSGCVSLTNYAVRSIASYCPQIEKLVINNIPNLSYIGTKTGMSSLVFSNLRRLDLSDNRDLGNVWIYAPKLEWLDISGCKQITDKGLCYLVGNSSYLNTLMLEGCDKITNMQAKTYHPQLALLKAELLYKAEISKDTVSFKHVKFAKKDIDALGKVIKTNATIKTLYLSDNNISYKGDISGLDGLQPNTTVSVYNSIGTEGWKKIAEALKSNFTITTLNLEYSGMDTEVKKEILDVFKKNASITTLNLKGNNIDDEEGKFIAKALRTNMTLTELNLTENEIEPETFGHITGYLARNKILRDDTNLTCLDLNYINIGDKILKNIIEAINTNTNISILHLAGSNIEFKGGKAIGRLLRTNNSITELYLGNNRIGDMGIILIASALKTNTILTKLFISNNNISEEGGKAIAKALKNNTTLTDLDLRGNHISNSTLSEIETYLERNKTSRREITEPALAANEFNGSVLESAKGSTGNDNTSNTKLEIVEIKAKKTTASPQVRKIAERRRGVILSRPQLTDDLNVDISEAKQEEAKTTNTEYQKLTPKNVNTDVEYNTPDKQKGYKLYEAANTGKVVTVMGLLRDGADTNYVDDTSGKTALHQATEAGHTKIVELLLNHSVPVQVNLLDKVRGDTALHIAADKNHLAIAKMLLDKEVDTNLCNNFGFTPLHYAVSGDHKDLVNLLLAHGADPFIQTNENKVALDYAQSFEMKEIFRQFSKTPEVSRI